jgi:hypothetical protein
MLKEKLTHLSRPSLGVGLCGQSIITNDSRICLLLRARVAMGIKRFMQYIFLSLMGLCLYPMMLKEKLTHLSRPSRGVGLCVQSIITNGSRICLLLRARVAMGITRFMQYIFLSLVGLYLYPMMFKEKLTHLSRPSLGVGLCGQSIITNVSRICLLLRARVAICIKRFMQYIFLSLMGLCLYPISRNENMISYSEVESLWASQGFLEVSLSTLSSILYDIVPLTLFLFILGVLYMTCFDQRIRRYSKSRRRTGLGCHIWSRRRIF